MPFKCDTKTGKHQILTLYATKSRLHQPIQNKFEPISNEIDSIGKKIVDSVFTVHKNLGLGLFEKVYEVYCCRR
ncbi:MAG: hypothetical protein A2033_09705 [Bacteroidetes bacterium GWA2_31_9]|nr:MAG: hypothetical protein A2033_09705 [Bacteroidetes bacterium GWA2_31_9]